MKILLFLIHWKIWNRSYWSRLISRGKCKDPGGEDNRKRKTGISGSLQKRKWGLETLGGNIPFEETVNVPGLAEGDHTGLNWILEDMKTDMINSRKLGVKAVITVEIHTEGETSQMAAST